MQGQAPRPDVAGRAAGELLPRQPKARTPEAPPCLLPGPCPCPSLSSRLHAERHVPGREGALGLGGGCCEGCYPSPWAFGKRMGPQDPVLPLGSEQSRPLGCKPPLGPRLCTIALQSSPQVAPRRPRPGPGRGGRALAFCRAFPRPQLQEGGGVLQAVNATTCAGRKGHRPGLNTSDRLAVSSQLPAPCPSPGTPRDHRRGRLPLSSFLPPFPHGRPLIRAGSTPESLGPTGLPLGS